MKTGFLLTKEMIEDDIQISLPRIIIKLFKEITDTEIHCTTDYDFRTKSIIYTIEY